MHMILLVLDDPGQLEAVLDAWEHNGIPDATIIESTGIHRRRGRTHRIHARFPSEQPAGWLEEGHYTLFTIVQDEETVRRCLAVTETVIGNLDAPHTGILAAWPLSVVKGVGPRPGGEVAR